MLEHLELVEHFTHYLHTQLLLVIFALAQFSSFDSHFDVVTMTFLSVNAEKQLHLYPN